MDPNVAAAAAGFTIMINIMTSSYIVGPMLMKKLKQKQERGYRHGYRLSATHQEPRLTPPPTPLPHLSRVNQAHLDFNSAQSGKSAALGESLITQKRHIGMHGSEGSSAPALGTEGSGVGCPDASVALLDAEVGVNLDAWEDEDGGRAIGAAAEGEGGGVVSSCALGDERGIEDGRAYVREEEQGFL